MSFVSDKNFLIGITDTTAPTENLSPSESNSFSSAREAALS